MTVRPSDSNLPGPEPSARRIADLAGRTELLERVVETVPAGMALLDRAHTFVWVNPYYARLWGRTPEAFVGQSVYAMFPEMERPSPRLAEVEATREVVYARGLRFAGLAGERYVDATMVPLFAPDGSLDTYLVMVLDVTDRAQVERAQQERIEALQRADTLKDQFLGVVSHELRTPIHILGTLLRMIARGLVGPVSEQQGAYLDRAMQVMQRLRRLVEDIIDMTMLQAGSFRLTTERMALAPVMRRALDELATLAADKDIAIAADLDAPMPAVLGDAERLMQVVVNLLSNAIKFSPAGSEVRLTVGPEGGQVRVAVSDRGPGIPPEQRAEIFRPFIQLDMSLTREPGGVGLGLAIVKGLVEAHGGTVGVERTPGGGSTFWFTLPRADMA